MCVHTYLHAYIHTHQLAQMKGNYLARQPGGSSVRFRQINHVAKGSGRVLCMKYKHGSLARGGNKYQLSFIFAANHGLVTVVFPPWGRGRKSASLLLPAFSPAFCFISLNKDQKLRILVIPPNFVLMSPHFLALEETLGNVRGDGMYYMCVRCLWSLFEERAGVCLASSRLRLLYHSC